LMHSGLRSVAVVEGAFSPLERVLLTAAGNVQRLVSAWHNKQVVVNSTDELGVEDKCALTDAVSSPNLNAAGESSDTHDVQASNRVKPRSWARATTLSFKGDDEELPFCTARSDVRVTDVPLAEAIASGTINTGAIFEHLGVLPRFELYEAGRRPCGGFWRRYALWAETTVRSQEAGADDSVVGGVGNRGEDAANEGNGLKGMQPSLDGGLRGSVSCAEKSGHGARFRQRFAFEDASQGGSYACSLGALLCM
jgi:hypothetical protein